MINRKIVILAVLFSILTAGSIYWYLNNLTSKMDNTEYRNVLVATKEIPRNSLVEKEMLRVEEMPVAYIHPQAVSKETEAVGKISIDTIYPGQQILNSALIAQGDLHQGLSYAIPKGTRAVSIAVNEVTGVSGLLIPGDHVDVVATLNLGSTGQELVQTSFILQDIPVLAVGANLGTGSPTTESDQQGHTITVAVTPKEAQPLVLATEQGSIRLLLRSPVDRERANLDSMQLKDFLYWR